ncbi:MAG: hypothetical protein ACKVQR_08440 [Aquabacterium sp.]
MELRRVEIFSGKSFKVPSYIVRLDTSTTHGWQLRYGTWVLYSDGPAANGAAEALKAAKAELATRIAEMPAPSGLRTGTRSGKGNDMPLGISGPIQRSRGEGGSVQYYLQVSYPVAGAKAVNRSVYVATENTLTKKKYREALAKAVAMRKAGVQAFELATTEALRKRAVKAGLSAG